jgi:hypothetical protein
LPRLTLPPTDARTSFDSYVSWQKTPKLTLALEGDYVIERLLEFAVPGHSAQPSATWGGAAYARYQLTPKFALGTWAEYLRRSRRTLQWDYASVKGKHLHPSTSWAKAFSRAPKYRRDFSNQPSFFTDAGQAKERTEYCDSSSGVVGRDENRGRGSRQNRLR